MPLITNSHDKSIAYRIHDGIWRACLPGRRYWTFRPHATLKIGFQSTWWPNAAVGALSPHNGASTSSCYPACTDSYNHRRRIPDRFRHSVKTKQPGCIWLRSKPSHPAKKRKKENKKTPKSSQKKTKPKKIEKTYRVRPCSLWLKLR